MRELRLECKIFPTELLYSSSGGERALDARQLGQRRKHTTASTHYTLFSLESAVSCAKCCSEKKKPIGPSSIKAEFTQRPVHDHWQVWDHFPQTDVAPG